jgi:hypothetical protein
MDGTTYFSPETHSMLHHTLRPEDDEHPLPGLGLFPFRDERLRNLNLLDVLGRRLSRTAG